MPAQAIRDIETQRDRALQYRGCYELTFRDWNRDEGKEASASIPRRVWLTGVSFPPDSGGRSIVFIMRPAPHYEQSLFQAERWSLMPEADSLVLTWDNFFSGLQVVLGRADRRNSATWRGRSFYWTDEIEVRTSDRPATPATRGFVTAQEVECW